MNSGPSLPLLLPTREADAAAARVTLQEVVAETLASCIQAFSGPHRLSYPSFRGLNRLCELDDFRQAGRRQDDDAVAIADDKITGLDGHTTDLDADPHGLDRHAIFPRSHPVR